MHGHSLASISDSSKDVSRLKFNIGELLSQQEKLIELILLTRQAIGLYDYLINSSLTEEAYLLKSQENELEKKAKEISNYRQQLLQMIVGDTSEIEKEVEVLDKIIALVLKNQKNIMEKKKAKQQSAENKSQEIKILNKKIVILKKILNKYRQTLEKKSVLSNRDQIKLADCMGWSENQIRACSAVLNKSNEKKSFLFGLIEYSGSSFFSKLNENVLKSHIKIKIKSIKFEKEILEESVKDKHKTIEEIEFDIQSNAAVFDAFLNFRQDYERHDEINKELEIINQQKRDFKELFKGMNDGNMDHLQAKKNPKKNFSRSNIPANDETIDIEKELALYKEKNQANINFLTSLERDLQLFEEKLHVETKGITSFKPIVINMVSEIQKKKMEIERAMRVLVAGNRCLSKLEKYIKKSREMTAKCDACLSKSLSTSFHCDVNDNFSSQEKKLKKITKEVAVFKKEIVDRTSDIVILLNDLSLLKEELSINVVADNGNDLVSKINKELDAIEKRLNVKKTKLEEKVESSERHVNNLYDERKKHDDLIRVKKATENFYKNLESFENLETILNDLSVVQVNIKPDDLLTIYGKIFNRVSQLNSLSINSCNLLIDSFEKFIQDYITQTSTGTQFTHQSTIAILKSLQKLHLLQISPLIEEQFSRLVFKDKNNGNKKNTISDLLICAQFGLNVSAKIQDVVDKHYLVRDDVENLSLICDMCEEHKNSENHIPLETRQCLSGKRRDYQRAEWEQQLRSSNNMNALITCFANNDRLLSNDLNTLLLYGSLFKRAAELYHSKAFHKKQDISCLFHSFKKFLFVYIPDSKNASSQHAAIIDILRSIVKFNMDLPDDIKIKLETLLRFEHVSFLNPKLGDEFLVCARTGINIQGIIKQLADMNKGALPLSSHSLDVAEWIFACYLHDANYPEDRIHRDYIQQLFVQIENIYKGLMSGFESSSSRNEILKQMLLSQKNGRFGLDLKSASDARYILQAAAFYCYEFTDAKIKEYLVDLLKMNNTTQVSAEQTSLYEVLGENLREVPNITICLEHKDLWLLDAFNPDILLTNTKTNKQIDIEYDGLQSHYYLNPDFSRSVVRIREDRARDAALRANDIQVRRFNVYDLKNFNGKLNSQCELNKFINEVKCEAMPQIKIMNRQGMQDKRDYRYQSISNLPLHDQTRDSSKQNAKIQTYPSGHQTRLPNENQIFIPSSYQAYLAQQAYAYQNMPPQAYPAYAYQYAQQQTYPYPYGYYQNMISPYSYTQNGEYADDFSSYGDYPGNPYENYIDPAMHYPAQSYYEETEFAEGDEYQTYLNEASMQHESALKQSRSQQNPTMIHEIRPSSLPVLPNVSQSHHTLYGQRSIQTRTICSLLQDEVFDIKDTKQQSAKN